MDYKIYTLPHCDKCEAIKDFLKQVNMQVEVVDLGEDDGVAALRKIYIKLKDKVTRTEDGQLPIPLFVAFDAGNVIEVGHTLDEVKRIVNI